MSTLASLSKRVIALQEEYRPLLQREQIDLSILPVDEQTAIHAFLASIEDKVDMASLRPYENISDDELDTLKRWALRLKALVE
jgi:hypothetical protein